MQSGAEAPSPADSLGRQGLALGGFYFFIFAALGTVFPFIALLLSARGLSGAQIGVVLALLPVANVLVPPVWGALADSFGARALLLTIAAAGCGVGVLGLVPAWGLGGALLAVAVWCVFRAPLAPLSDATTRALLGQRGADYGRIRLWGSAGFAAAVAASGLASGAHHPTLLLAICAGLYFVGAGIGFGLPRPAPIRQRAVLRLALRHIDRRVLILLVAAAFYYAGHAVYDGYFSLYVRRLGFDERLVGVAWGLGVVAEIGVMAASGWLLRRFRSESLLLVCALTATVRWLALAWVNRAGPIIAIEALHGITFGLWYVSFVDAIQSRAPEALRSTLQAAATSAVGLGMFVGYLGAGALIDRIGGHGVFLCAAIAAGIAAAVYSRLARRAPVGVGTPPAL